MTDLVYPVGSIAPLLPALSSVHGSRRRRVETEILPVVQEDGMVVARAGREYCHSGSHLLHPVVHLHLVDRQARIYLQKRSEKKNLYPGRWDTAVGGHVSYGESICEALFREAGEELHLREFNPIFLGSYCCDSAVDYEFVSIFAAVGSFNPDPDGDEVSEGRWWTVKEIEKSMKKGIFTPIFESEFKKIKRKLLALL